jgi:glycosyltransferase involved in cell wall biosynthesis
VKIAHVAASPIPSGVASSVQVVKMCQGMARLGHEVVLLAPQRPEVRGDVHDIFAFYGVDPCFEIRRVSWPPAAGPLMPLGAAAMGWAARRLRPDLVYGRFPEATTASLELGLPVVFETHLPLRATGAAGIVHRRLLHHPRLRRLVVISEALKREYLRLFEIPEHLVAVVPDAADDPGEGRRHRLGPSDRLQVAYVGNVYRGKGVETVLALAAGCRWADFHVIGGDVSELAPWVEQGRHLPNLRLHGFVPHGQTDRFRLGADVLLAPYHHRVSTHGGGEAARWMSPLKLFEYMAAGRPIIVSDLPVLREVVHDGVDALMCEPENTTAWAEALGRLARDADLRARLGREARAEFLRKHTWTARARAALSGIAPPTSEST